LKQQKEQLPKKDKTFNLKVKKSNTEEKLTQSTVISISLVFDNGKIIEHTQIKKLGLHKSQSDITLFLSKSSKEQKYKIKNKKEKKKKKKDRYL